MMNMSPTPSSTTSSSTLANSNNNNPHSKALAIATLFCKSYYSQQHNNVDSLYSFYDENNATVQRQSENDAEKIQTAEGQMAIHELFMSRKSTVSSSRVEVTSIDALFSVDSSLLISIRAKLIPLGRFFTQTFLLVPILEAGKQTFVIRSDIMRIDAEAAVELSQLEKNLTNKTGATTQTNIVQTSDMSTGMDRQVVENGTQTDKRESQSSPLINSINRVLSPSIRSSNQFTIGDVQLQTKATDIASPQREAQQPTSPSKALAPIESRPAEPVRPEGTAVHVFASKPPMSSQSALDKSASGNSQAVPPAKLSWAQKAAKPAGQANSAQAPRAGQPAQIQQQTKIDLIPQQMNGQRASTLVPNEINGVNSSSVASTPSNASSNDDFKPAPQRHHGYHNRQFRPNSQQNGFKSQNYSNAGKYGDGNKFNRNSPPGSRYRQRPQQQQQQQQHS